jgi:hypothetical protein
MSPRDSFKNITKDKTSMNSNETMSNNSVVFKYTPNSLTYLNVVGKGGFGKVWRV